MKSLILCLITLLFSSPLFAAYESYDCIGPVSDLPIFIDGDLSEEIRININTWYTKPDLDVVQSNGTYNTLEFIEKRDDDVQVYRSPSDVDPSRETPDLILEIHNDLVNGYQSKGSVSLSRDLGGGAFIGQIYQCE
jgi:hypothetical protein